MHKFRNKPGLKKSMAQSGISAIFICVRQRERSSVFVSKRMTELQHRELIRLMAPVIMRAIT